MQPEGAASRVEPRPDSPAIACFLWGAARSGTNAITRNLARSPGVTCYNEDDPRAFDCFFLQGPSILDELIGACRTRAVFFKSFNDTPRAREVMARLPSARAIYAIRNPDDTIGSFAATWGEYGRRLWTNRLTEAARGEPGMLMRLGASDAGIARAIRDTAAEAVELLRVVGCTDANVAGAYYVWQHSFFLRERLADSGRILLVDYDRLTAAPVEHMARIASWFGVESGVDTGEGWRRGRGRERGGVAAPEILDRCRDLYAAILRAGADTPRLVSAGG